MGIAPQGLTIRRCMVAMAVVLLLLALKLPTFANLQVSTSISTSTSTSIRTMLPQASNVQCLTNSLQPGNRTPSSAPKLYLKVLLHLRLPCKCIGTYTYGACNFAPSGPCYQLCRTYESVRYHSAISINPHLGRDGDTFTPRRIMRATKIISISLIRAYLHVLSLGSTCQHAVLRDMLRSSARKQVLDGGSLSNSIAVIGRETVARSPLLAATLLQPCYRHAALLSCQSAASHYISPMRYQNTPLGTR